LLLSELVAEQYPLAIFHGDVGTGKTANAECLANRIVAEARAEDSILFKLSNRVRGSGKVEDPAITAFERLFRERGLPLAVRSDNGVPFASPNALFNLSKLSVW
jgi:hypothetical protein